jgi:hypothetical protein
MSPLKEMYAAADDVSDYAVKHQQARFQPIGSAIPDPRPAPRFVPAHIAARSARSVVNDADTANALEHLSNRGELSDELSQRIDDIAMEFAERRINGGEFTRPVTPSGKYVGIAFDACAALRQIITTIRGQDNFDQFSEVDVDNWAAICRKAGYSL